MNPDQSNTRQGNFPAPAAADLIGKRSYLVKVVNTGGVLQVSLPAANGDLAFNQLEEEGAAGVLVDVHPLADGEERRLVLKGTCNPGDQLVNADVATAADKGKVRVLPGVAGTYRVIAIASEVGVDGQHVKARVRAIGNIVVP